MKSDCKMCQIITFRSFSFQFYPIEGKNRIILRKHDEQERMYYLGFRKKNKKMKKVSFDPHVKIQNMYLWTFAYHAARLCDWRRCAADRYRFALRKQRLEAMLVEIGFFSYQKNGSKAC